MLERNSNLLFSLWDTKSPVILQGFLLYAVCQDSGLCWLTYLHTDAYKADLRRDQAKDARTSWLFKHLHLDASATPPRFTLQEAGFSGD